MHKIVKNLSWVVSEKVLLLLANIYIMVAVANHYGANQYGFYQYAMSLNVLVGICLLLLDGRIVKKEYDNYNHKTVVFNATIGKIVLSLIALVIGVVVTLFLNKGDLFSRIFLILLVNNIVLNLGFGIQNYFEYHLQSKKVVIAANIATILSVLMQTFVVINNLPIILIASILLASSIVKFLIILFQYLIRTDKKEKAQFSISLIKRMLIYSLPLSIAASAAIIYTRVDQVMLGAMLDDVTVGVYSVSTKMLNVATILILPLQISIFPKLLELYKTNKEQYFKLYKSITGILTLVSIAIIVGTLLFGGFVFDVMFTDEYQASFSVFQVQIFSSLFMYNAALRSSHFTISGDTDIIMKTQITAVFINLVLNLILINLFGIYGAAIATVTTQMFSLFISNLFFENSRFLFKIQSSSFNLFNGYKDLKNIIINLKSKGEKI